MPFIATRGLVFGLLLVGLAGCKSTMPGTPWAEVTDLPKKLKVTDQGIVTRTLHVFWDTWYGRAPATQLAGSFYADAQVIERSYPDLAQVELHIPRRVVRLSVQSWSESSKESITEIDLETPMIHGAKDGFTKFGVYRIVFDQNGKVLRVLDSSDKPIILWS